MKIIKIFILFAVAVVFTSCNNNDDQPQNHAPVSEDMEISMDENPTSDILTALVATDLEEDVLRYAIQSQIPTGSIQINEITGEVFIFDINAFDYEQNTTISASIIVSDGTNNTIVQLTINILDVNENS